MAHPFPFMDPAVVHFWPSNDVTSGRYPLLEACETWRSRQAWD